MDFFSDSKALQNMCRICAKQVICKTTKRKTKNTNMPRIFNTFVVSLFILFLFYLHYKTVKYEKLAFCIDNIARCIKHKYFEYPDKDAN